METQTSNDMASSGAINLDEICTRFADTHQSFHLLGNASLSRLIRLLNRITLNGGSRPEAIQCIKAIFALIVVRTVSGAETSSLYQMLSRYHLALGQAITNNENQSIRWSDVVNDDEILDAAIKLALRDRYVLEDYSKSKAATENTLVGNVDEEYERFGKMMTSSFENHEANCFHQESQWFRQLKPTEK